MTAQDPGSFKVSQGFDVLQPRSGEAYPIPCEEWDFLKGKLKSIASTPWFYQTLGAALIGAAVSTGLTALFATLTDRQAIIAWSAVAVTAVCGVLSLLFAHQQKDVYRAHAQDVLTQMEIIETRYERVGKARSAG